MLNQNKTRMTIEDLKKFMSTRPQITAYGLEKEAGLSEGAIKKPLDDIPGRNLTQRTVEKLLPVLEKYGYKK